MEFTGEAESFEGAPPSYSLAHTLGVDPSSVANTARFFLEELESQAPLAKDATAFATSYRAFWSFQDLMEVILSDAPLESRHYFYYESLGYLREIGHCLLNGNFLAVLSLQRQFLELAVFHVYWRSRGDELSLFYKWLTTDIGKPPFRNGLDELFGSLPSIESTGPVRTERLKDELYAMYRSACSYNHVAHLSESYVALNSGNQRATFDAAKTAVTRASLCTKNILLLYGLAYPMVLFPRSIESKFGFGGPVGTYAPHETGALYTAAIGEDNATSLRDSLIEDSSLQARLCLFDSMPDLDSDGLEQSWQDYLKYTPLTRPPRDFHLRRSIVRATWRSLGWIMNYANVPSSIDLAPLKGQRP